MSPLEFLSVPSRRKCTGSELLFVSILLYSYHTRLVFAELIADVPGDIILGGIFPLHENSGHSCGAIRFNRGIQRVEAMLVALDKINNDCTILPGITLGAKIVDSCSSESYALNQSLNFVRGSLNSQNNTDFVCMDGTSPISKFSPGPLAGVVGESYSSVTIQIANLLNIFAIPQISAAATSDSLSGKSRFPYFARTVPPDKYQAKVLVDIMVRFNWTYVSYVASDDEYGQKGIEMFIKEARARKICIAVAEKIPSSPTSITFDDVIQNLRSNKKARVVVVFAKQEHAFGLMQAATRAGLQDDGLIWLGTDQWGIQKSVVSGSEHAAVGAITIELQSKRITDFDDYLLSLYPGNPRASRNPWFLEFWETYFNCNVHPTISSPLWIKNPQLEPPHYKWRNRDWVYCAEDLRIRKDYDQDAKVPFVIDAVYAFARALDTMLRDDCNTAASFESCSSKLRVPPVIDGKRLYRYIRDVSYTDRTGHLVEFDENGDGVG